MRREPLRPGLLRRLATPPRKVVVVRASRIGDFICATPALRALRRALPAAEITLIGLPFVRELAARSPHLDRFEPFPGFLGIAEQFFDPRQAVAFLARLQAEEFDLAIQLHGSGAYSNTFTRLLGARRSAGFVRSADECGQLDAAFVWPTGEHEVRRALDLMCFLGAPERGEALEFPLWPEDHQAAADLLAGYPRPLVGLHPSARDPIKLWPLDRFAALGRALQRRFGATVVLLGGPDEAGEGQQVADAIGDATGGRVINLAGHTSLATSGAVIARLALLVTNDSAPAHMAYALGTPSITIFGGTDPRQWGARVNRARHVAIAQPISCRPCEAARCPVENACLQAISVEQVKRTAARLLQRFSTGSAAAVMKVEPAEAYEPTSLRSCNAAL